MDSRKVKICYYVSKNKNISLNEISNKFNKTDRTIRNDIDKINVFLKNHKFKKINIENNIVNFGFDSDKLFYLLNNLSYSEYYLDSVERRAVIILYALLKKDYFIINDLTDFMKVSRSTVNNDLEKIKDFISNYNYMLLSEPAKGIRLKEINRSYRSDLILDLIGFDISNIERFFNQKKLSENINNSLICENYLNKIDKIIRKVENQTGNVLTNYSFEIAKYFLYIYLPIIRHNKEDDKDNCENLDFIGLLINEINYFIGYKMDRIDRYEISSFIHTLNFSNKIYQAKDSLKAQIITGRFIEEVSDMLGINFKNDKDLLKNLSNHLSSIMENSITKIEENLSLNEYVKDYPHVKDAVRESIWLLKNFINIDLNELEINYLVVYIVTAIEKKKNNIKDIDILLVCSNGFGTSFLIKENIKKIAPSCKIELSNYQNYKKKIAENIWDIIISTIKLDDLEVGRDYILLEPILTNEKKVSLLEEIDRVKMKKIYSKENGNNKNIKIDTGSGDKIKLTDLLTEKYIKFDLEVSDRKQAIRKSAESLLEDGLIEENYVNAMIKNVEKFGSYIVISKGIALAHASSECGVNKTAMSLIKLKNPVKFYDREDPIDYFICMSSKNNEHFNAFLDLVKGLQNKETKREFSEAKDKYSLYKILKNMEN